MKTNTNKCPEQLCTIDEEMTFEKLNDAFQNRTTIVGIVTCWSTEKKELIVNLSNGILGCIPQSEISIYPVWDDISDKAKAELYTLIGKSVCVKVIGFRDEIPILSRRKNMQESFEEIKKEQIVTGYIRGNMRTAFFIDIGSGIYGILPIQDYVATRLCSITDMGTYPGMSLNVIIKDIDFDTKRVSLGYKELFPNLAHTLHPQDIVQCVLGERVKGTSDGFFCTLNPNTSGIVNVPPDVKLTYGQKVTAIVRSSGDKLKLRFLHEIS